MTANSTQVTCILLAVNVQLDMEGKNIMTNTKITRTINIAIVNYTAVNMEAKTVGEDMTTVATTQHLTDKQAEKLVKAVLPENQMLLKVDSVTYDSRLYEMDLNTFIEYAHLVGDGRVQL